MRRTKLKVGDRIKFHAIARFATRPVTRKVNGFWVDGRPTVNYQGYKEFVVRWREIIAVERVD